MTKSIYTPQPGDRLYQVQRTAPGRFTKIPVDIIRIDGDGQVVVSVNKGRPKRWSMSAVAALRS